ncbi:MAG: DNA mismatch repair protein MutS [Bacteroidales bacterium]|nr:DNA mismatch repair protein MutS [Bacteroidales bacterium]
MVTTSDNTDLTPLMRQYNAIKAKYPDALLLFRVGDFYETFGQDAILTSKILDIVLTRRANGAAAYIELAGFPYHALDTYLPKLVKAGQRVAICDQLEDPRLTKKIVKRGVTELVTPGVSYNDKVLETRENNFLAGVHLGEKITGIAFLDVSTGEFYLSQGSIDYIDKLIQTFKPSEVLLQKNMQTHFRTLFGEKFFINTFDDWVFTIDFTRDLLQKHFGTTSLKGFGVDDLPQGIIAAGAVLHYLAETQHDRVQHICKISRLEEDRYVWLDKFTVRNLELISTPNEHAATLLQVMDHTISPMGSRLLKKWILLPLKDRAPITERHQVVDYLIKQTDLADLFHQQIKLMGDMERLISKVAVGRISPREILQMKRALEAIEPVRQACLKAGLPFLQRLGEQLNPCPLITRRIGQELMPDPPALVSKGNVIRDGVSEQLDELRRLMHSGKDYLVQIQQREIARTGISSLKVGYNNVFGYYLEVTHTHRDKVPADWMRKQTLVNSERYITDELKEYEEKILGAEEKILELELQLFEALVTSLTDYIEPVQLNARLIARLDCLLMFSVIARKYHYVMPEMDDSYQLDIRGGRHPVIEYQLPPGERYIPNDVLLDPETQQIIILTGPNMSGKSALLRQTALIVLMAQMGSFVPADKAQIGVVDKIFTRVGASDNISSGESTFMVEMNETASILNNISNRSLILLDEIGRGTSTYDGISIAWAIAEYLHEHPLFHPKILFATHYHELNEMAARFPRIKNYHISIKEINNRIIFLRKLEEGGSEHSFGIHVAKMAGMPGSVLERADAMLRLLEQSAISGRREAGGGRREAGGGRQEVGGGLSRGGPTKGGTTREKQEAGGYQLSFIQLNDPLLEQIRDEILNTDINTLTPVEALMKLNEIKKMIGGK